MKYEDVTAPHDSAVPHAALLKILFENMVDDVTLDYMILLIRYMVPMIPLSLPIVETMVKRKVMVLTLSELNVHN